MHITNLIIHRISRLLEDILSSEKNTKLTWMTVEEWETRTRRTLARIFHGVAPLSLVLIIFLN